MQQTGPAWRGSLCIALIRQGPVTESFDLTAGLIENHNRTQSFVHHLRAAVGFAAGGDRGFQALIGAPAAQDLAAGVDFEDDLEPLISYQPGAGRGELNIAGGDQLVAGGGFEGRIAAMVLAADPWKRALLLAPVVLLLVIELLNTAIEKLCDRISGEFDLAIGRVKDMGSAAIGGGLCEDIEMLHIHNRANWS